MIQKLVLSALLLGAASANAQTKTFKLLNLNAQQQKQFTLVNNLIQKNPRSGSTAHRPTAIKQRVVAQVLNEEGYSDSVKFYYTGSAGSQYNYNNFTEPGYSYQFSPDLSPAYNEFYTLPSTDVKADSISSYSDGEQYMRDLAYYNSAGMLDSSFRENISTTEFNGSYKVQYNSSGQATSYKEWEEYGTSVWGLWRRINHNTLGQVSTDSFFYYTSGDWMNISSSRYVHNSSGKLDTIVENYRRIDFTYDDLGRLKTSKTYQQDMETGIWELAMIDSIGYTSGSDYITFYQNREMMGSGSDDFRIIQYPGSNPGPDSFKIFSRAGSSWTESTRAVITYNEQGNPIFVSARGEELEGDLIIYYEDYDDGLSNKDIVINKDFSVYPNPFKDNIVIENGGKLQRLHVSLTDISGKLLYNKQISLGNGINNLHLPQIQAGNYLLRLEDATGKGWSQKMVKK